MQDMFVNRLTKFFSGNTKHQRFTQNDAVSLSTFVDDTDEVSFYVFLSYTISHRKYRRVFCLAFKLLSDICNNYKPSLVYIVIWMKLGLYALDASLTNLTGGLDASFTNVDVSGTLFADTINEKSSEYGITIDGVLIKDNNINATTFTGNLIGNADTATEITSITNNLLSAYMSGFKYLQCFQLSFYGI